MRSSVDRLFRLPINRILLLVGLGIMQVVTIVSLVLLIRQVIDQLTQSGRLSHFWTTILAMSVASLALAVLRGVEFRFTESVGYELVRTLRLELYDHLVRMSPRSVLRGSRGALILRFTGDLSTLRTWISRGFSRGVTSSLTVAGTLALLFWLNLRLGTAVIGVLLLGVSLSLLAGDSVRRATKAVRWRRSLLTSNISEQIAAIAAVQVFGRVRGERSRFSRQNEDVTASLKRMASVRGRLRGLSSATSSAAVLAVVIVGAHEVSSGRATVGVVVAAIIAARFFSGPLLTLGRSHEYWQAAQVSKRKIREFLNRPGATPGEELRRLTVRSGEIVLRQVSVEGSLDDINLTVDGGQILAILGPNGAGKSTLLNLIARLVEPDLGQVLIDGQVLRECTAESIYRHLGVVSPELPLMRGTVRRNVLYRYPQADDEELERVVHSCRLDQLVSGGPDGLKMWLLEGGSNLPAGHRQRIALARATVGSPRLLLLDEPTSNLDEATKEVFRRLIARYAGTVVLVTHDPAEASLADRVCLMEGGRIVEELSGNDYRARLHEVRRITAGRPSW